MRLTRQIFRDYGLLDVYFSRRVPGPDDLLHAAFLRERRDFHHLPDHFFKNERDRVFQDRQSVWSVLRAGLAHTCDYFFDTRGWRMTVKPEVFAQWQDEVSRLSPLAFIAFQLYRALGAPPQDATAFRQFAQRPEILQFRHSLVLGVRNPQLDHLIEVYGLHDLHIHLNGTTEVDQVWLHALENTDSFRRGFMAPAQREEVRELLGQIDLELTPSVFCNRLVTARRLRLGLFQLVLCGPTADDHARCIFDDRCIFDENPFADFPMEKTIDTGRHPVPELIFAAPSDQDPRGRLLDEILMLMMVYGYIDATDDHMAVHLLYGYLLCLNAMFVPSCVQNAEQAGFDQFQKFTIAGSREAVEAHYRARFHQMSDGPRNDLRYVEGRIAPKATKAKMEKLLRALFAGYQQFRNDLAGVVDPDGFVRQPVLYGTPPDQSPDGTQLGLIVHFIKERDLDRGRLCRYEKLRLANNEKWRIFHGIWRNSRLVQRHFCGIDAAANELHAPPEVFAPLYRRCRADGVASFTYHVGEDFEHLVSGIRALEEAVLFLDLRQGDRIGHGTAIGIDPGLWLDRTGGSVTMRQGDHLDNLVYARHCLAGSDVGSDVIARWDVEINRLVDRVFQRSDVSPALLFRAWQLRRLDPTMFARLASGALPPEERSERLEFEELLRVSKAEPEAFALFKAYHDEECRIRSADMCQVERSLFPENATRALQRRAADLVRGRGLIIEVPPTSNLRISHYTDLSEHHLFRWLCPDADDEQPLHAVLATDDPGIFHTGLRNELQHVMHCLSSARGKDPAETKSLVSTLLQNGAAFRFRPSASQPEPVHGSRFFWD